MTKIADSRSGDEQTVSREQIAAVVEETHPHGAKVSIHSRGSGSTRHAALAGAAIGRAHRGGADLGRRLHDGRSPSPAREGGNLREPRAASADARSP
jgi:predicted amidohydrolase YtcJ